MSTTEPRQKTYKREITFGITLFWAGLIIWGHIDPSTGAAETGESITIPVFMLIAGAFGIDAFFKQGPQNSEFSVTSRQE